MIINVCFLCIYDLNTLSYFHNPKSSWQVELNRMSMLQLDGWEQFPDDVMLFKYTFKMFKKMFLIHSFSLTVF